MHFMSSETSNNFQCRTKIGLTCVVDFDLIGSGDLHHPSRLLPGYPPCPKSERAIRVQSSNARVTVAECIVDLTTLNVQQLSEVKKQLDEGMAILVLWVS